ncbi:phenylalanine--tRNA ligase subunit alpha [Desulfurella sp.]|uniref:phenylalanine--tRNA ligase subunit alpha n=1 Tax=Desulfurella sp. TaxID=1962857 RepID=UPI0025BC2DBA|nr:phenylalanine--tRNA ligase subunit alpha [Desulfurella sp.]
MHEVLNQLDEKLEKATTQEDIKQIKSFFLGKNGYLTNLFKQLSSLEQEDRIQKGKILNELKEIVTQKIESKLQDIKNTKKQQELIQEIDLFLDGKSPNIGCIHPVNLVIKEISDIFLSMGFGIEDGPEVELDLYNFELLNIPKNHPARDMQDTFYIDENRLLRTQTSGVQVRTMLKKKPPLMFIAPGRVYRRDSDLTHSPMFHQIEGLAVDKNIRFSDLKGVLEIFLNEFFGKTKVRFRPSYFPFTEPSAEVDIGCVICGGKGCRVCSNTGYLEVLGCGMVHRNVLKNVGYEGFRGFAFGLGVERFAMLKYGIDNIRLMFENDLRFLEQFSNSFYPKGLV